MIHEIGTGEKTQSIIATNEDFSLGTTTSCGDLVYEIQNAPSFLTITGPTLTVTTGEYADQAA